MHFVVREMTVSLEQQQLFAVIFASQLIAAPSLEK